MRLISQLKKKDLQGKRVLLRADFDVPVSRGKIVDDFRLRAALPTIKFLLKNGAKVTIIAHLGRRGESLAPVKKWLTSKIKNKNLKILENIRQNPGEMANDREFAQKLASLGDIFVNDAFAACHREHASIVGVPKLLPSYAGLQLEKEIKVLGALNKPAKPLMMIVGGAKFESKLPVVNKFINKADKVFIGGALANLFFKRLGYEVGGSFIDPQPPSIIKLLKSKKVTLPVDVVVKKESGTSAVVIPDHVGTNDVIVDAGPKTIDNLAKDIKRAKTIVWNGPLGVYESGFTQGTEDLAKLIIKSKAKTVIGGGDIVAVMGKLGLIKKFSFVSTGGGAMLEFLAHGTLPGIKALK